MTKNIFLFNLLLIISTTNLFSNDIEKNLNTNSTLIKYNDSTNYTYTERTNLRRYDNGKYVGLVSREVCSFIAVSFEDEYNVFYDGNFFINEKAQRNSILIENQINESIPSSFKISKEGNLEMIDDNGFPSFRSFPTYPNKQVSIGDKWQAKAIRVVDPLNKGVFTKIPFYVEYEYLRDEFYNDQEVFLLSAKWATRYGAKFFLDFDGDKELLEAQGNHNATIYISKKTGAAIVIQDTVDEFFTYSNGTKIAFKGTINLFTKYQPSIDKEKILPLIQRVATKIESTTDSNITFQETPAGIKLTIENLQFKPDSSELLDTEKPRLLQIAQILSQTGSSFLLVEGHTAFTANESGEMQLSKERAKSIAQKLSELGIDSSRFIVRGHGSHKPIADNSTKEGMAKNRRVEITITE